MTQKQKIMLENLANINSFSFDDNLKIGNKTIKLKEIENYDIPMQNEIINKIMKKQYSIDYTEKIEKLKEKQKQKNKQNQIALLKSKTDNCEFWLKYGEVPHTKNIWKSFLEKYKKELEELE